MSQIKAIISGSVVADPEAKDINGAALLSFPLYVNHTKKNKTTNEYEKTGDVSKVKVSLWRDLAESDIQKGDIVEVSCTLVEKEFSKQDGSTGRSLQTDWVESVEVKYRKPADNDSEPF